ncbi:MAG: FhaA domain-containing protein [Omnitrophica WOR_2 bacterium]
MKINFARLEAGLQSLIEGSASRLFSFGGQPNDVSVRLVSAMQANIHTQADGSIWAPNLYNLVVHPAYGQILLENNSLLLEMAQMIYQAGVEAGVRFPSTPQIKVLTDPGLNPRDLQIQALFNLEHLVETSDLEANVDEPRTALPNAFLIVNGDQIYPLNGSALNIGRSVENQLVVEDLRVSRSHAQLRYINGKYVIFDLGSTGGTFVNGQRVSRCALYPGDVVSLAGASLIFGVDKTGAGSDTQKYTPGDDNQPFGEQPQEKA